MAALHATLATLSGPTVLIFRLTVGHSVILIVTGVLALASTAKHRLAFWFTVIQAVGYTLLFITTTGRPNWLSGAWDDVLHGMLAAIGLALLLWISPRGIDGWIWVRRRARSKSKL